MVTAMSIQLAPNKQPIYPSEVIKWKTKLTNQTTPRDITTQVPVLVGEAGDNGSIIHEISCIHLGNNVATVVRLYSQLLGLTPYFLELELSLPAIASASDSDAISRVKFDLPDLLPSGNKGLHLEAGEKLYCGLGTAIASGIMLTVRGGNY